MNDQNSGNDNRSLIRIIKFSSAIGLGTMAAVLYSIKQVVPVLKYEITFGTGVSFLVAVALSWAFWRLVFGQGNQFRDAPTLSRSRRRWLAALSLVLTAATVVPFVWALKGVTNDQVGQVAQGSAIAVAVLGAIGFLFWRVTHFLNADTQRHAEQKTPNSGLK
jgi:hypothetical protein